MIARLKEYRATIVLTALSLLCLFQISRSPSPDAVGLMFPRLIVTLMLVFSILLGVRTFIRKKLNKTDEESEERAKISLPLLATFVAFIALLPVLGFFIITPLFIFSCAKLFNIKTLQSAILAAVLTVVIYLLFVQVLFVPFPSGLWIFKSFNEMIIY